ncbi:MAG TPA: transcription termination factor NusA [bacterium]|nr:transcription termination/antitermination protein NusA [bacterium]HOK30032.1 transcription termination factor NusA [bacterium]HOL55652.1 transcription termination factor NusA [bacterium]HRR92087.1 transcription termination factor NusA [bacterium]HRU32249.1 transcription termination factor NusA [bacterium]
MTDNLLLMLKQIEKEKGISIESLFSFLEAALLSAYRKQYGTTQNVSVIIDRNNGDIHIYAKKSVVEKVENNAIEIGLEDALKVNPEVKVGDVIDIEIIPSANFGRFAYQTAKQVITQKLEEAEKTILYEEFSKRIGEITRGTIYRIDKKGVYLDLGRVEGVIPPYEQVDRENYKVGDKLVVYILKVIRKSQGPEITCSRSHPNLVKKLFELEIPEIQNGIVVIKGIAREPGIRTKIAVASKDSKIDPAGTCIGAKGIRIQPIVRELKKEKIDVIVWNEDPLIFVGNALNPASVIKVEQTGEKSARVLVAKDQLPLAIGKEGQNVRLAVKLTGWKIDIKTEEERLEKTEENRTFVYSLQEEEK